MATAAINNKSVQNLMLEKQVSWELEIITEKIKINAM